MHISEIRFREADDEEHNTIAHGHRRGAFDVDLLSLFGRFGAGSIIQPDEGNDTVRLLCR